MPRAILFGTPTWPVTTHDSGPNSGYWPAKPGQHERRDRGRLARLGSARGPWPRGRRPRSDWTAGARAGIGVHRPSSCRAEARRSDPLERALVDPVDPRDPAADPAERVVHRRVGLEHPGELPLVDVDPHAG